jgi:hypothetical protein
MHVPAITAIPAPNRPRPDRSKSPTSKAGTCDTRCHRCRWIRCPLLAATLVPASPRRGESRISRPSTPTVRQRRADFSGPGKHGLRKHGAPCVLTVRCSLWPASGAGALRTERRLEPRFGLTVYAVEVGPDDGRPPMMEAAGGQSCARRDGLPARSSRPHSAPGIARHHTDPSQLSRLVAHPIAATTTGHRYGSWRRARHDCRRAPRQAHNAAGPHRPGRHTQKSGPTSAPRRR